MSQKKFDSTEGQAQRVWWRVPLIPGLEASCKPLGVCFLGEGTQSFLAGALTAATCMATAPSLPGRFAAGGPGESRTPKEVATTDSPRGNGETEEKALIPERTGPLGTSKGTREKKQQNVGLEEIILERVLCIWLCFAFFKNLVEGAPE